MRMHPRAVVCKKAQSDLHRRITQWLQDYDLTTVEELAILNHTLSGTIGGTLKYCIREEREKDDEAQKESSDEGDGDGGRHREH